MLSKIFFFFVFVLFSVENSVEKLEESGFDLTILTVFHRDEKVNRYRPRFGDKR